MKHIKLAALVTLAIASSSALAATESFNATVDAAAEATIANSTPIHFGTIQVAAASACTMDNAGAVTGQCDAADAQLAIGVVDVSGLQANTSVDITVATAAGTDLTFSPQFDVNNATAASDGNNDGDTVTLSTDGSGTDLLLDIYGTLTVNNTLTPGAEDLTAPYTVTVDFN